VMSGKKKMMVVEELVLCWEGGGGGGVGGGGGGLVLGVGGGVSWGGLTAFSFVNILRTNNEYLTLQKGQALKNAKDKR